MKHPSTRRSASRPISCQSQLLPSVLSCSLQKASCRRTFSCISVATLPPRRRMASNSSFQNAPVQKPGTTARSRQISTSVRPSGRRRTCATSSSRVGMNNSGSFHPTGREGGRTFRVMGACASASARGPAAEAIGSIGGSARVAGAAVAARSRGATKSISRPRAARASNTRSSAIARRMPRCRCARILYTRPVPKQDAMALKSVLAERGSAVAARCRP